jgi:hypothetical protein
LYQITVADATLFTESVRRDIAPQIECKKGLSRRTSGQAPLDSLAAAS